MRYALEKKSINDHTLIYGCHFPFPGLVYIEVKEGQRIWRALGK